MRESSSLAMEGTMPNTDIPQPAHPTVDFVLGAIADWVRKYRSHTGNGDAFARCSPDEVKQIAKELGMSPAELRGIARKEPGAADLLQKMLIALGVDPEALAKRDPAVMRDLQRLCISCSHKRRCQHELAAGAAAEHFHEFCPNAFTLDALLKRESLPFQH
jgi:transcriptional regulator with XRE-family HTH domain